MRYFQGKNRIFILPILILLLSSLAFAQIGYYISPDGSIVEIICGDGICSIGENIDNCPIDCRGISFNAGLEIPDMYVYKNSSFTQRLIINSYELESQIYNIIVDNNSIVDIDASAVFIDADSSRFLEITFSAFEDMGGIYNGNIEVSNNNEVKVIPYIINIISQDTNFALPKLHILSSQLSTVKPVVYRAYVYFSYLVNDATVRILLIDSDQNEYVIYEKYDVSGRRFELLDSFKINDYLKTNYYFGDLSLKMIINDGDNTQEISQIISIQQSLFSYLYFRLFLIILIGLPLTYFLIKLYFFIQQKRLSKRRYLLPNFKLLPSKSNSSLKVGKIADTIHDAFFDTYDLTTHMLVAGSTGSGKSVASSIIVEEALEKKIPVVIFDPTAQWTGLLSPLKDNNIMQHYSKFGLSKDDTKSYKGIIFNPKDDKFEVEFEEYLNNGEATIFNLSSLSISQYNKAVTKIIDKLFAKHWEESSNLKLVVVFDEVHRLLDKSIDGSGYSALTKACREFRKWGIGLVMASQVSSDFKEVIGGNILTEVQLNTKNMSDINKISKKYGADYSKRITRMGIGVALVQNPKYNNAKPWFIGFRPPLHNPPKLSESDLKLYDKYISKLKEIKEKINKISDTSTKEDLEMDYSLAYNKLKEGKFKIVEIYLQSLTEKLK
ncbi:MAG: ATP-binding protein [Candidatus Woesearchaeota archaeon]